MSNILSSISNSIASLLSKNVSDLANNLVIGYKFYVFIGPLSLAFNKISGIEQNYNYETIQEGGVNDRVTLVPGIIQQPSTLHLENGGMTISVLEMTQCFNSSPKEVLILLCTASGKITNVIDIDDAVVSKVSIGDLDANDSSVVITNIEMSYTGMTRIPYNVT